MAKQKLTVPFIEGIQKSKPEPISGIRYSPASCCASLRTARNPRRSLHLSWSAGTSMPVAEVLCRA